MSFGRIVDGGHEQVVYSSDPETGLCAITAIHDTHLGPGVGGTRFLEYDSEEAALEDALRLSKAMTYKTAAADLDFGGAKTVIVGDPDELKTEALLEAYGRAVDSLGGRYVTAIDVNTTVEDMDVVARETDYVVATSAGPSSPSAITAYGIYHGIRACVERVYGTDSLADIDVVVQGLGKVGRALAEELLDAGASVTVSDVDERAVDGFVDEQGVDSVAPEAVYEQPCDVFAPCAIGGIINDQTVPKLQCEIVAGGANNALARRSHARELARRDVLYAPDYVLNAGGLITGVVEMEGGSLEDARTETAKIGDRLRTMIERADERGTTVLEAADEYAEERIGAAETTTPTTSWS